MSEDERADWINQFPIQSAADLDCVISQDRGVPIGMMRSSPAEFKRRVLAAGISYQLRLRSIDYTLKQYVAPHQYEDEEMSLGDVSSDFIKGSMKTLKSGLKDLHSQREFIFGVFGAEITLFKFPETLDLARMLANRGLLLEVLPILRLCLEMISWSAVAFFLEDETVVRRLRAQSCISRIKPIYASAGQIYGHLSKFTHWEHAIHSHFLELQEGHTAVIAASCRYRAMSLTLCLVILDMVLEVIRHIYSAKSEPLITTIQGVSDRTDARQVHQMVAKIAKYSKSQEFQKIQSLLR
jgi:hypothetical protein